MKTRIFMVAAEVILAVSLALFVVSRDKTRRESYDLLQAQINLLRSDISRQEARVKGAEIFVGEIRNKDLEKTNGTRVKGGR